MSSASSDPHISSLDERPLSGYRGVSVAAVLAGLLGVASALALVHPLLWIVPLVTIVVALVALRAIQRDGSNLTGSGLALCGLALALLFGLWAPARLLSRQWQLYHQAQVYADEWLELIRQGKLHEAHQLALQPVERQPAGTKLEPIYGQSEQLTKRYKTFYSESPLKKMAAAADKASYHFLGGDGIAPPEHSTEQVALKYEMQYENAAQARSQTIRVVLDREETENGSFVWRISEIADPNRVRN